MENWREIIVQEVVPEVRGDPFWEDRLANAIHDDTDSAGFHLAIFREPYLSYVLDGSKSVESRFASIRVAPYGQVYTGDIVLLKRPGGPTIGLCVITKVWFYSLDVDSWNYIRDEFSERLRAQDPEFWEERKHASYATLMQLGSVRSIQPVNIPKRDRRGWAVLRSTIGPNGLRLN
jgi:hypothetical protein